MSNERLPQDSHAKVTRLSHDKMSCGCCKTNAWLANYYVSRTNTLRVLQQSCGSLVSCGCRTSFRKRKQIAKKMNMSKIHCGSLTTLFFVRQSCGVVHNTVRLQYETKKFVVADRYTAVSRLYRFNTVMQSFYA